MDQREPLPVQRAGRIRDARGRTVSQLDPVMMHLFRRQGIIPSDALREIAESVGPGVTRATRTLFWATAACAVRLAVAVAICSSRLVLGSMSTARVIRSLALYVAVLGGLAGSWISLRSARRLQIGRAMLQHRRCPHCGYDLRLLPTDPADGATVCPECGCAWKLRGSGEAPTEPRDGSGVGGVESA